MTDEEKSGVTYLRIESSIAGRTFVYQPGDIVAWPHRAEAERLIERGIAEEIPDSKTAQQAAFALGKTLKRHRPQTEAAMRPSPAVA